MQRSLPSRCIGCQVSGRQPIPARQLGATVGYRFQGGCGFSPRPFSVFQPLALRAAAAWRLVRVSPLPLTGRSTGHPNAAHLGSLRCAPVPASFTLGVKMGAIGCAVVQGVFMLLAGAATWHVYNQHHLTKANAVRSFVAYLAGTVLSAALGYAAAGFFALYLAFSNYAWVEYAFAPFPWVFPFAWVPAVAAFLFVWSKFGSHEQQT